MGLENAIIKTSMNKNIKKTETVDGKIEGLHTFSFCDIRHAKAQKLEIEIENRVAFWKRCAWRAYQDLLKLKFQGGLPETWDNNRRAQVNLLKLTIKDIRRRGYEEIQQMYAAMRDLTLVNQFTVHNIIPTAGRAVVAEWITGDNTHDAANGANFGSLGTSNTAPANGDTTLTTETYRKATSSANTSSNVAFLSNFYTATEVTGTFEEAGWHIDGTGAADSGELLSHFLSGTIIKANTETLTIESSLTIS